MVVAVFYPHTIGMFIDTPPSTFYNIEIPGYNPGNRTLNELASKIMDSDNQILNISMIEDFLLSMLTPSLNLGNFQPRGYLRNITVAKAFHIACSQVVCFYF